ncbi:MAG TPA: MurT ligase domain-containing protein, partial [Candidatus Bathyarchaeia archaeon]|nr:MurT ligase domain-containing protein [Candidatus Bathyarchaeia archaeon]
YPITINLPGIYNIYNALAAFTAISVLKIPTDKIIQGFKNFRPAFGRFEQIKINGKMLTLMLIKNPAGFNQVLKTLGQLDRINRIHLLIALNDLIADGRDVSWIWDVDVKALNKLKIDKLIVSGTRLYDMAIRLKYALKTADIHLEASLKKAVNTLINPSQSQGKNVKNLYILATYTAMLEIRKILAQKNLVHSTWKD